MSLVSKLFLKERVLSLFIKKYPNPRYRNFQDKNDLNPGFMKNIFCPIGHKYNTRHQNLSYPNPKTVSYGLETFGCRAKQIWNSLSNEIKSTDDLITFKMLLSRNNSKLCTCNLCKNYIRNLGYV